MASCFFLSNFNNMGDMLTPLIFKHFGIHLIERDSKHNPMLTGIGSLLNAVRSDYRGLIWSAGAMYARPIPLNSRCVVKAVRGKHTLALLRRSNGFMKGREVTVGDGGLILDRIIPPRKAPPKYKLGVVPHWFDRWTVTRHCRKLLDRPDVIFIDICQDARTVIAQMQNCEGIIASSLHGLVVADAYGIPNRRFIVSTSAKIASFKYNDYYSAFLSRPPTPFRLTPNSTCGSVIPLLHRHVVPTELKDRLWSSLEESVGWILGHPKYKKNYIAPHKRQTPLPITVPRHIAKNRRFAQRRKHRRAFHQQRSHFRPLARPVRSNPMGIP